MAVSLSTDWTGGWAIEPVSGRKVCYSRFNPEWCAALGIVPKVILDVGAYDGGDAIRLQRAFPEATVVSVEGDPMRAEACRKAVANTGVIFVEGIALDRDGVADWYQGSDASEFGTKNGSVFRWPKKPKREPDRHRCIALFNVLRSLDLLAVDLLHIDVEGAELLALRGLEPIRPRLIWAELADSWPDAPGSAATHAEIVARGYEQVHAAGSDRLYVRHG